MSDQFVQAAKDQRHVLERLIMGLPGIRGYMEKETRRNADYRLRQMIAGELERTRGALYDVQNKLLGSGGLAWLDDVDRIVTRLGTLTDRVKTASYGYAGLFDTVRVDEKVLDALHRFDVALLHEVAKIESAVANLAGSMADKSAIAELIEQAATAAAELTRMFDQRERAILSPDLLTDNTFVPDVELPDTARGVSGPVDSLPGEPASPDIAPDVPSASGDPSI
jgi:hypothetical protein